MIIKYLNAICMFCILGCIYIQKMEFSNIEKRLSNSESLSVDNFKNIEKIKCQHRYGSKNCDNVIDVPDYSKIEKVIIETIKEYEKFSNIGYKDGCDSYFNNKCVKHRYSIGYGTREKIRGEIITEEEALIRLKQHLKTEVYPYIPKNVSPHVFIALADLGYNAGARAIKDCVNFNGTLNYENYQKWIKCNGKRCPGLEKRRRNMVLYVLGTLE